MKISLFTQYGALNSSPVFEAIRYGLGRLGHTVINNSMDADAAVIWSVLWNGRMAPNKFVFESFQQAGKPVIVAEVGCLKREWYWRLSLFNPNQQYPEPVFLDRWSKMGLSYKNKEPRGEKIVIVCQRTDSLQWQGQPDIELWLKETIRRARVFTDRPVVIRAHPRQWLPCRIRNTETMQLTRVPQTTDSYDLDVAINRARVIINHNASPAITSVLAGVPVITGLNGLTASLAHEVSIGYDEIETNRIGPGTEEWLNKIAHTEWTIDEIAWGTPLELLLQTCVLQSDNP